MEQALGAQVVGADKAVALAAEYSNPSSHAEGWADIGDYLLLGQYAQMVGTFQKYLHQVGAGPPTGGQQGFEPRQPTGVKTSGFCARNGSGGNQGRSARGRGQEVWAPGRSPVRLGSAHSGLELLAADRGHQVELGHFSSIGDPQGQLAQQLQRRRRGAGIDCTQSGVVAHQPL